MLVKFRSKAAADVMMYEEHAKQILDLLGKDVKRGIITAAEADSAIARLEQEIAESKMNQATEETGRDTDANTVDDEDDTEQERRQHVSFATRVYPLLEMLREANKGKHDVMWGIY